MKSLSFTGPEVRATWEGRIEFGEKWRAKDEVHQHQTAVGVADLPR